MTSGHGTLFDLAIIGGGINGAGIARDAAGRGWSVFLCEQGDLGGATSSASTKLIHGGLRYLEYYEFRLVREALMEREVLWGIAPHIIWPLRFVLPHHKGLRPRWLLRLGLFLYDHLGGRRRLPPTRSLDLRRDPAGAPLKPDFTRGFEYSDCWVEDSRLVVLNARDAADRGAEIATRTRCVAAERAGDAWRVTVRDETTGAQRSLRARALVNAAGPWVAGALAGVIHADAPAHVRLVKGSHVVVPRLFDHDRCYIFQNADRRIFFAIPYERDFTLIGTTDQDYTGDPAQVRISEAEIAYLCQGASAYFRTPVTPAQVVWTYSGVRPLYDDGASAAQAATRDYVLALDAPAGQPALLTVFGGKITTFRRLAEAALARLAPHLPAAQGNPAGWTAATPLPGGDFPVDGFGALVADLRRRWPFLSPELARRLARAYGTRAATLLGGAASAADLGRDFGAGLTEAELRYLARAEWAMCAADVVWRRSKLGLRMRAAEIEAVDQALQRMLAPSETAQ
ncbi:glycerol-3-phosphate dehydrogenase [Limobrevibacterium gyesilva]|uniref:Glycerol-3-phosphate dehydrogenase n=1 Tax=Limobrevibacterium gyesilva TaxID=2991712 RepID=A0AA42CF19_9PROT|nr:glycerol-3-phosphate dehydrogenase [Limobrevibacterium gyesilva]MCW3474286.1 glycerol-3-phosphate dehydrogenase [Limobrevibacterium gyesilva]